MFKYLCKYHPSEMDPNPLSLLYSALSSRPIPMYVQVFWTSSIFFFLLLLFHNTYWHLTYYNIYLLFIYCGLLLEHKFYEDKYFQVFFSLMYSKCWQCLVHRRSSKIIVEAMKGFSNGIDKSATSLKKEYYFIQHYTSRAYFSAWWIVDSQAIFEWTK